jgi:hypothetical protein
MHHFLSLASVAPISSPRSSACTVNASISARFSQISRHSSTLLGGITTTPSISATIRSPGLIVSGCVCSDDVNSIGTFKAEALVKVFEPSEDDDFANSCSDHISTQSCLQRHLIILLTGNPIALCSLISRKLPSITTPCAPKYFARVLIKPPQHAEYIPLGCEMKTTLSFSIPSAKCLAVLGAVVLLASTI